MAKAVKVKKISDSTDTFDWAKEVLLAYFEDVVSKRPAALEGAGIEGVHDMRVATRRLRSTLRDFLPFLKKERPLKPIVGELKRILDILGLVRDQDVAIVALEKLQTKARSHRVCEGIEILLERRRALREKARAELGAEISAEHLDDLRRRFIKAIGKARQSRIAEAAAGRNGSENSDLEAVSDRLKEFRRRSASLYDPLDYKRLHKFRISTKRLRYAVRLYAECRNSKAKKFARQIAKMQKLLGTVHDCDVWIENLHETLTAETAGRGTSTTQNTVDRAAVWLLAEFVKKRTKYYLAALDLWQQWERGNLLGKLEKAIVRNRF